MPAQMSTRATIALCVFLAIAAFLLFTEHRAHVFGALPYLLILACPLMHIFMHGGHDHGDQDAAGGAGHGSDPHMGHGPGGAP